MWTWIFAILAGIFGISFFAGRAKSKHDASLGENSPHKEVERQQEQEREQNKEKKEDKKPERKKGKKYKAMRTPKTTENPFRGRTTSGSAPKLVGMPPKREVVEAPRKNPPSKKEGNLGVVPIEQRMLPPGRKETKREEPVKQEKKKPVTSHKEAKKVLRKLYSDIERSVDVKHPEDIIDTKLQSMTNIDMKTRGKPDRKRHNAIVTTAVMRMWDEHVIKTLETVDNLSKEVDRVEDPTQLLFDRPDRTDFKAFVRGSDKLITETSEKYDYYMKFIRERADRILAKLGPIDPKREEIENLCKRAENRIANIHATVDDYIVFVESEEAKLDSLEKGIDSNIKNNNVYKTRRSLEGYKATLESGKDKHGKTVDELVDKKVTSMSIEGIARFKNAGDRDVVVQAVKSVWEKKCAEALKLTESLLDNLKETKDYETVAKKMPNLSLDAWIESPECREIISSTNKKMNVLNSYTDLIKQDMANNLALLGDEELKKYIKETMGAMRRGAMDVSVGQEEFKTKAKEMYTNIMNRVRKSPQQVEERPEAKRPEEEKKIIIGR